MPFIHRVDRSLLVPEPCTDLRRLGSANDGGYVVALASIVRARHLLSFGVATNWDFERAAVAANPTLAVDAYDPEVGGRRFVEIALRSAASVPLRFLGADPRGALSSFRRAATAVDYFRFFSGGVRHRSRRVWYNTDRGSAAIDDILDALRAENRGPTFAKIDIEGSEYRILPSIIDDADLFTGLVVEFHDTDICADIFNAQVAALLQRFRIVHVHGNNYGDLSVDGSLPLSLEISFVHRSIEVRPVRVEARALTLDLDAPNDPNRPDYVLDLHGVAPRAPVRRTAGDV